MGKLYTTITALLLAVGAIHAAPPSGYEWWFDNDISSVQTGSISGDKEEFTIDVSSLPKGMHRFNCRLSSEDNVWGSIYTTTFYTVSNTVGVSGYEWWIDNGYETKTIGEISEDNLSFPVDLSDLVPGMHRFNCRLNTVDGEYGSIYSKYFYTVSNKSGAKGYEYWFDNRYSSKVTGSISENTLTFPVEITDLVPGMHYFNCRLENGYGEWGSVYRSVFFTTGNYRDAVAYEYWIDNNYKEKASGDLTDGDNLYTIDVTGLRKGLHRFNYRIRTTGGEWGSVYSTYFYCTALGSFATDYEYWLDDDYSNRVAGDCHSNATSFNVDLSGLDRRKEVHYFNIRMRNGDEWGSVHRKLIVLPKETRKAPIIGYAHSLNGNNLGYVKIENGLTDSLAFMVDIPDSIFSLQDKKLKFDGDVVSVEGGDSLHYALQLDTELGLSSPTLYSVEVSRSFSATAVPIKVNSLHEFEKPAFGEFAVAKFTSSGTPLYFRADQEAILQIYRNGERVAQVAAKDLKSMAILTLEEGEYFAVLRDVPKNEENSADKFTFHLMSTPNIVPTPTIEFVNERVTIRCAREDAEIYYTLNDSVPTVESLRYAEPFPLKHNAVVKAMASVPKSDIQPSDIVVLRVDSFTVANPVIRMDNLDIVIVSDTIEGVKTHYTLDGTEPTVQSVVYETPFRLGEDATVRARSFKEGYNASEIVEYVYTHSLHVTKAPIISVENGIVTLTVETEGSELYYGIDNDNPEAMSLYESPFEMNVNGVIYAQARMSGMYDSEIVSYEVNGNKVPTPVIRYLDTKYVSITCDNQDVDIYYTTDESAPTTASTKYEGEFEFDRNGVIKAIAVDNTGKLDDSNIAELVIDTNKVANPIIRIENLAVVIIPDQHIGVHTYYTLDGSEPTESSEEYGAPFMLSGNVTVRARSYKEGYTPSGITDFGYSHNVYVTKAPVISVEDHTVTLTAQTEGSELYYGIDNDDPAAMRRYESPFKMNVNGIIYAQARMSGMYDSEIVSYEINGNKLPLPNVTYDEYSKLVEMEFTYADSEIYYTTDGSAPTTASTKYEEAFEFDRNGVIKAIAVDPSGKLDNSNIAELVIDSNTVDDPLIRVENMAVVIVSDLHAGVHTYYTLDGSEPTETSTEYGAPFMLSGNTTVRARSYKEGYNPSSITDFGYVHSTYTVKTPVISADGNTISIAAQTEGSSIYCAVNNNDPVAMSLYESPFTMSENGIIYAQARKTGMYDSEVVSYELIVQKTKAPYGRYDKATKLLSLHSDTEGAVISYSDNGASDWIQYSEPILIEGNRRIYAKVLAPNYLESDVAEIVVSEFKCQGVEIVYNGRYVTLTTSEEGAEIRYTLDGGDPTAGEKYTGRIDAGGLCTVKAVTVKDNYMNSDVAEYVVRAYGDEEHAETAEAGILSECYGWADSSLLASIDRFSVAGPLNEADYALLRAMTSLRHLDLKNASTPILADNAFAGMGLVSVSLPSDVASYGENLFSGNTMLCAVIWNAPKAIIKSGFRPAGENPNILLYLNDNVENDVAVSEKMNLIVNGNSDAVTLHDRYPFHAPLKFDAAHVEFVRNFSKVTEIGGTSGWETLTLPFDVQTVTASSGEILPFASTGSGAYRYWLFEPSGTGWQRTDAIDAYKPYLIAMPNHPWYYDEYIINGDVTFESDNVTIEATPEPEGFAYKGSTEMWATYMPRAAFNSIYLLNDDSEYGYAPGSVFQSGIRDARPFECYLTSESGALRMPVFESSDVEDIMAELGTKIWVENHDLLIRSGISQRMRIFDTVGQLVRIADVTAGEVCRVHDLAPGIYIIGQMKIMVK